MCFQIFEEINVILRKSYSQGKRFPLMSKNLDFCLEFDLEPFVVVEAGKKAERDVS